jgi:hypothetical protein
MSSSELIWFVAIYVGWRVVRWLADGLTEEDKHESGRTDDAAD